MLKYIFFFTKYQVKIRKFKVMFLLPWYLKIWLKFLRLSDTKTKNRNREWKGYKGPGLYCTYYGVNDTYLICLVFYFYLFHGTCKWRHHFKKDLYTFFYDLFLFACSPNRFSTSLAHAEAPPCKTKAEYIAHFFSLVMFPNTTTCRTGATLM